MPIRKAVYAKGFQRVPQLFLYSTAVSGVFPSIMHTAFESVQYTAGRSRYRASMRYIFCNILLIYYKLYINMGGITILSSLEPNRNKGLFVLRENNL